MSRSFALCVRRPLAVLLSWLVAVPATALDRSTSVPTRARGMQNCGEVGSEGGGSGHGRRITAEQRSEPSSPSAPAGSLRLGTKTYTYDDLYRLTGETLSGGTVYSKAFGYDAVGNRLTQQTVVTTLPVATMSLQTETETLTYDTRDRLLDVTATGGPPRLDVYTYDANGNILTKSSDATYTWDTENRLVRIVKLDGTVIAHAYDADGVRIRTTTTPPSSASQETNFLTDTSGGLSHVVVEADATNAQKAYYLRASDELLSVIRPTATPGAFTTRYFHADGIGSIRKLTDETGAITDSYEYTAFGERYSHLGSDVQPYSFAGEPYDPNTGFQYHRARWMQPNTGRFAGMDPVRGSPFDPATLHRYLYASSEPAAHYDPTGTTTLGISVTIGAMIGALSSFAVPNASLGQRVGMTLLGATIGAVGGVLYAGAATASLVATAAGASVWLLPPLVRGRILERTLGQNLPSNYPVIDRFMGGIATSIKSLDLAARTYQDLGRLGSTISGYVTTLATWPGLNRPWGFAPAIPGVLIQGREVVLALPRASASLAQMQVILQQQAAASARGVQLTVVWVH